MKEYYFYRISILTTTDTYIGSTANFKNRKHQHKTNLNDKTKLNVLLYKTIHENGGWDNVNMELLENGNYENRKDVFIRERELIELHKPTMNSHLPSKIDINYGDNPKEYKQKWHEDYVKNNPDKRKERVKINNDKRKEAKVEWYNKNKEKLTAKAKEKVICDLCGKEYTNCTIWNHKNKSKAHQQI